MAETEIQDGSLTNLTPRHGLSPEDLQYCHIRIFSPTTSRARAYVESYGDPREKGLKTPAATLAADKEKSVKIQRYLRWVNADPYAMAQDILREQMVIGNASERRAAAKELRAAAEKQQKLDPVDRYFERMTNAGATIVAPVMEGQREARVSLAQVLEGEAWLHLSPKALVELLHAAGAPWNEYDPRARLSPLQIEIIERNERMKIVHGGSGVGKSVLGGCSGLGTLCLPGTKTAIIGQTYDLASSEFQYVYEGFLKLFGPGAATRCVYTNTRTHHDMEIQTAWGASCIAFSLERDQGGQMYGKEFDRVILAEASRISADTFLRAVIRALNRRLKTIYLCLDDCPDRDSVGGRCRNPGHSYTRETGYADMFTTPVGYDGPPAHIYEETMRRTERRPERVHYGNAPFAETVYIREADCLENPSYSTEAYEAARNTLPPDIFDEQFRGLMVRRSGLIYKEFNEQRNIRDRPEWEEIANMRLGIGIDTGKHFAAVLAGIDRERTIWVLGEVYTQEWTTRANMLEVANMVNTIVGQAWRQPREQWYVREEGPEAEKLVMEHFHRFEQGIDLWRYDPASQEYENMVELLDVALTYDKLEQIGTINRCRTMMENGTLLIGRDPDTGDPATEWLIWELSRYRWKLVVEKRGSNEAQLQPERKDNHACDALRYIAIALADAGPLEKDTDQPRSFEEAWNERYVIPVTDWQAHQRMLQGQAAGRPGMAAAYHRRFH